MKSIQARLTVYIIAGTATLLLVVGLVIDSQLGKQLEQEFDRSLLAKAMSLVTLTEQDQGEVEFDLDEDLMPEFKPGNKPEYYQLWLLGGEILSKSTSLEHLDLSRGDPTSGQPEFVALILPDQRLGRLVMFSFLPQEDKDEADEGGEQAETNPSLNSQGQELRVGLALAKGRGALDELLFTMRMTLLAAFLALMLALAVFSRVSIQRGLLPLKRMTTEVQNLDEGNLHKRLTPQPGSEELAPITSQLNALLARLDDAFQREKRFSGNVAHELRTPIAELRALAEVGKGWPEERDMVEGFFADLVDLADDMETTVVNLLMLAKLDAGNQAINLQTVDLSELTDSIWKRLGAEAEQKKIRLDNRLRNGVNVQSDKDKLKLILINVLYNAVTYCPADSSIVIDLQESETGLNLSISNQAVDLTEQDLSVMFERFWRKEQVHTRGSHAGLGLSLVKALADLLNLGIKPRLEPGDRFTLLLSGLIPV